MAWPSLVVLKALAGLQDDEMRAHVIFYGIDSRQAMVDTRLHSAWVARPFRDLCFRPPQ